MRTVFFLIGMLIMAIVAVWFLMRGKDGKLPWERLPDNPWYTLEKDFAEGRIDRQEYESRKEGLLKEQDRDDFQNE